jgi:hypothetical protein
MNAGQYSYYGVDTDFAALYTYANGGAYRGDNQVAVGTGGPYDSNSVSIFDPKDHPGDTCTAVGGKIVDLYGVVLPVGVNNPKILQTGQFHSSDD